MLADYKVVIDANVLANYGVCDLFLRLAERPRLFVPRWSCRILEEVKRTQTEKMHWPEEIAGSWQEEVMKAFPNACVDDFDHLIDDLTNDPKDRHVLAAAIRSGSDLIVTFNLKDFPESALSPWGIHTLHPENYLMTLYSMAPERVVLRLNEIAQKSGKDIEGTLLHLGKSVPNFVSLLIDELDLNL